MPIRLRTVALALTATAALLAAGCSDSSDGAAPAASGDAVPGISTHGTGTVTAAPDTMTLVLAVQTQAADASSALDENAAKANAVIGQLKDNGVESEDIQTSNLSVHAKSDSDGTVTGYEVTNQVTATVHDIDNAGTVIDAAAAAAGNAIRVRRTTFSISDDSDLRARARADAVHHAHDQAKQIADAAGVDLDGVRSITEVPRQSGPPAPQQSMSDHAATTPVEPGTKELTVTVDAVYNIG